MNYLIKMEPVAKARPRVTKQGHTFTPKKTKAAEIEIKKQIKAQSPEALNGALKVEINFYFKRPKTVKRKYHTVKPDCDNLTKLVCDALNGILWKDDAQIVNLKASKNYSESNGFIELKVEEIR